MGHKRKSAFVVGMPAFEGKAVVIGPKADIAVLRSAIERGQLSNMDSTRLVAALTDDRMARESSGIGCAVVKNDRQAAEQVANAQPQ